METSESIRPDIIKMEDATARSFGRVISYQQDGGILRLITEIGEWAIYFVSERTLRIVLCGEAGSLPASTIAIADPVAVAQPNLSTVPSVVHGGGVEGTISFSRGTVALRVDLISGTLSLADTDGGKSPFTLRLFTSQTGETGLTASALSTTRFYGLGEKPGELDKRNDAYTMWNSDVYAPHVPEMESLYVSIPLVLQFDAGVARGLFVDNPGETHFDFRTHAPNYEITAATGGFDLYLLLGPSLKDVVQQYAALTGCTALPPKWALGYHQSRYSYESQAEVLDMAETFRQKNIPLDAIYLDIHYMDGYRVFTFDTQRFPQPAAMVKQLLQWGVRMVPIVDPGVKRDADYTVYRDGLEQDVFCQMAAGQLFSGEVWPGESVFPDFTDQKVNEWWAAQHDFYVNMGISGIWNDMNEPAVFNESKTMDLDVIHSNNGNPKPHRELHNLYGMMMSQTTYEGLRQRLSGERPFVLTRAGYAGIQRYAAVWTGDNRSFWSHLEMAMPMVLNMGLSGLPFGGPDVGGFAHHTTAELLIRWTQMGAFFPFFRNHSALGTHRQEPWSFGPETEAIVTRYIRLRYTLMPYLYSVFRESATTGLPVMRPLVMEYPDDEATYNLSDEFFLGRDLLVAPVYHPDERCRKVYLPQGTFVNVWTGERLSGPKYILVDAPLEEIPLFVREGAIIPVSNSDAASLLEGLSAEDGGHTGRDGVLVLHIYPGQTEGSFKLYEDDGLSFAFTKGAYSERLLQVSCVEGDTVTVSATVQHHGYGKATAGFVLRVHWQDGTVADKWVNNLEFQVNIAKPFS